jgi:hypothetical protein
MIYIYHICILCATSWGGGAEESSSQKERETGGQTQFDWMLHGGSWNAQPVRSQLICFEKKPIDGSEQYIYKDF